MKLRAGTRGSDLALTQTNSVVAALQSRSPKCEIETITVKTLGDSKQGTPQAAQSDKKDWILELELAVLRGDIDFAIHSGKDVPCDYEDGTTIHSVLPRANPFDIFIGKPGLTLDLLPENAVVGTASLRRRAQLILHRSDLSVIPHRGNVPTRIRKLEESEELSGIVLAGAGVERLKLSNVESQNMTPPHFIPALNQGILCVQYRSDDEKTKELLASLIDPPTECAFQAEREIAEVLQGDCKSAIAIYAEINGQELTLTARVMTPDGKRDLRIQKQGPASAPKELGQRVAEELMGNGARTILEESREVDL